LYNLSGIAAMSRPAHTEKPLVPGSLLPIRTVSSLTGVNAVTLRAWERRYNLITPQRTPKGHRLYTQADVERIRQVLDLLEQGISISQVKPLLDQTPAPPVSGQGEAGEVWRDYQQRILGAVAAFDQQALDTLYNDALSLYPAVVVTERLTTPLLRLLGERWRDRATGIAEEHFFSVYLRNRLGARIHHVNQRSSGPLLLLACLPGEQHEIGLLLFALASIDFGYRILVLGANTPLEQLPAVHAQRPCAAIVLSSTSRPARGVLEEGLPALVHQAGIPVLLGGRFTAAQQQKIVDAGAISAGETIGAGLQRLGEVLNGGH
jgi:DNA-binding transcriptional MerR regulator